MNLLMTIESDAPPESANVLKTFKNTFPPSELAVRVAVPVCRVQKCHDSKEMKLFIKRQRAPNKFNEDEKNLVEDAIMVTLAKMGGERLVGQAPRGALERRAQELLNLLGESTTPSGESQSH